MFVCQLIRVKTKASSEAWGEVGIEAFQPSIEGSCPSQKLHYPSFYHLINWTNSLWNKTAGGCLLLHSEHFDPQERRIEAWYQGTENFSHLGEASGCLETEATCVNSVDVHTQMLTTLLTGERDEISCRAWRLEDARRRQRFHVTEHQICTV